MTLPRIIGVTGYARHGKDTVAGVLTRELGYSRVALADKMKELLLVLNPAIPMLREGQTGYAEAFSERDYGPYVYLKSIVEDLDWDHAKQHPEVRRLLQVLGTEVGREGLKEDVWIEALASSTKGFYGNERKIVIPDVRFVNEAQFIRRVHGEVWKVERPDFDNGIGTSHASERELGAIKPDVLFRNQGSKARFQDEVFRYLKNRLAQVPEPSRIARGLAPHGTQVDNPDFEAALAQAQETWRPALNALEDR